MLILAPHSDEETLSAAEPAQQVLEEGGEVRSVVVTAGDAYVEAIQNDLGTNISTSLNFFRYGKKV